MSRPVYIWDLPVRLFHWLLVLAISSAYISGKTGGLWLDYHIRIGIFIIALIVFRVVWGFVGSSYARFSSFMPTPAKISTYLKRGQPTPGHSPLAALSILTMLAVILLQAGLGLFAYNDEIDIHGPLYALLNSSFSERLTGLHVRAVNVLILLIGIHLLAIVYYTRVKNQQLIRPMLSGWRIADDKTEVSHSHRHSMKALLFAVLVAGMAFWMIDSGLLLRLLSQ